VARQISGKSSDTGTPYVALGASIAQPDKICAEKKVTVKEDAHAGWAQLYVFMAIRVALEEPSGRLLNIYVSFTVHVMLPLPRRFSSVATSRVRASS
jgi:hypothetical protein